VAEPRLGFAAVVAIDAATPHVGLRRVVDEDVVGRRAGMSSSYYLGSRRRSPPCLAARPYRPCVGSIGKSPSWRGGYHQDPVVGRREVPAADLR
jgi:hypothetical protein